MYSPDFERSESRILSDLILIYAPIINKQTPKIKFQFVMYSTEYSCMLPKYVPLMYPFITLNKNASNSNKYLDEEVFIPNVEDFQVILKDKEGKILVPVCNHGCGSVEDSQGKDTLVNTKYGQLTKGQANVDLVHTAEIYLTVRSPKEVYATAKPTKIINGEAPHGSNINIPADKYHRETFFVSVHTRNLAKHVAISEQTGTSIG